MRADMKSRKSWRPRSGGFFTKNTVRRISIFICLSFLAAIPLNVFGQDGIFRWFEPLTGKKKVSLSSSASLSPRERVKDQNTGLEDARWETSIFIPMEQGPDREWAAVSRVGLRDIHTRSVLPDAGAPVPSELWDLQFGVTHRRRLPGDWIIGGYLSVSSPSDRPFNSWDEMAVMLNGSLRIPAAGTDSWVFFLSYSTNREFLPHVPIPGAAYFYAPSRDFNALIGMPLLSVNYSPLPGLELRAFYFPIHSVYAGCEYRISQIVSIFTHFRWENDQYYRAGREDKDDRLFWYEKRVEGGIKLRSTADLEVVLSGGYAFDRFFFEGENYDDDRTDNRVDVDAGPFIAVRAGIKL